MLLALSLILIVKIYMHIYRVDFERLHVTRGGVRKERVKARQVISRYLAAKSGLTLYLVERHAPFP